MKKAPYIRLGIVFSVIFFLLRLWAPIDLFEVDYSIGELIISSALSGLIFGSIYYWLYKFTQKGSLNENEEH